MTNHPIQNVQAISNGGSRRTKEERNNRNNQIEYINERIRKYLKKGNPVI